MSQSSHLQATVHQLLSTKLRPPRLRARRVPRLALLARLDQGLHHKLTLVSAPAGFGKTTIVSEWLASRSEQSSPPPTAWVSLDEGDNDPVRFWRYVLAACQTFGTSGEAAVGETALAMVRTTQHPSFETMLTAFINDLTQLTHPAVLVLEDYHIIHAPQVHEAVAFLLDYIPATLHLILITRRDPPLPLARLRAQHEICELRTADLRFSPAEIKTFLQQNLPFPLSPRAIDRLVARTEGWVAGLQLVTLALQRRQQPWAVEDLLETFSGGQRHILDYLAEEVLSEQPEHLQEFLLKTSVLSRLTGSLCDAVTGRDDSGRLLEQVERANLFLLPLEETHEWYRYHPLFAEAMQQIARRRLDEVDLHELYDKASRWYAKQGDLADAIEAALAARSYVRAADLIESATRSARENRELYTVRRWLEQLPADLLHARPRLCLSHAMALLFTADRSAPATVALVQEPLQRAEQHWLANEDEPQLGQLFAFRSMVAVWQGDFPRAFATAQQALDLLPEQDLYWRGISLLNAAMETLLAGQGHVAQAMLREARALSEVAGNGYGARAATYLLGEVCIEQGELHRAAQLFRQVLDEAGDDRLDQSHGLLGLATLAYEWNDLDGAEQYASEAHQISRRYAAELGEQLAEKTLTMPATLLLARVELARGEFTQTRQRLQTLDAVSEFSPLLRWDVHACQTRLALAAGDLHALERSQATPSQEEDDSFPIQQERAAKRYARTCIASGKGEEALGLLKPWQDDAHTYERLGSKVEILALVALAHAVQDDLPRAKEVLVQSLTLAQPGEYQRLFLDEGAPMAALLQAVYADVRNQPLGAYVRRLLLAFAEEPSAQPAPTTAAEPLLVEPLSPQEERVLRLLAAGLSNPEIARELVVSVNTIKTQVQSIYRKLDVHSRTEARDVARTLGLI